MIVVVYYCSIYNFWVAIVSGELKFYLFRLQMFQTQLDMFLHHPPHASELLMEVLSKPLRKDTRSRSYFTADIHFISESEVYLKLARSRQVNTIEFELDKPVVIPHDDNPYIHVFIDCEKQVLALNRDSRFASRVEFSAKKLSDLIEESSLLKEWGMSVEYSALKDPVDFIHYLREAKYISRFSFEVRRENVIDPSEYIIPLKKLTGQAGGTKTRADISGGMIKKDVAEDMARAIASTGDEAFADVMMPHEGTISRKHLTGSLVSFSFYGDIEEDMEGVFSVIESKYSSIRDGDEQ